MKILILNYEYPPIGGGAGNQTQMLAKLFVQNGHQVRIITSHFKKLPFYLNEEGIEIIRVPVFRREKYKSNLFQMGIYLILAIFPLLWTSIKWRPNIALSFFLLPTSILAYLQYKFFRIPYIVSLRGGDVPSFVPNEIKIYKYLKPFANIIGKSAKEIIAVSEDLGKMAVNDFPAIRSKIGFINNGIMVNDLPKKFNAVPTFLFVGRLTKQKRMEFIINSFKNIKGKYIFNIVGDGPLLRDLKKMVFENGLSDRILFKGWLSKGKVYHEMQNSHFLILMSEVEGLSNSGLEAYANGLPIIASNAPGIRNFVVDGFTGFLINTGDGKKLSETLEKIINNPEIASKLSKNCKNFVRENYDINISAKKYMAIFEKWGK